MRIMISQEDYDHARDDYDHARDDALLRARSLVSIMTGSKLLPIGATWKLQVSFRRTRESFKLTLSLSSPTV